MKRLAVALMAAAALTTTALTATAPASAGPEVDITPPAVGSCHDLTIDEAIKWVEPDEPVDCTTRHTTVTHHVIQFEEAPDWEDMQTLSDTVTPACLSAMRPYLGGTQKALEMSAYVYTWYLPTKAQREAGANWVRCDLAVIGRGELRQLPTDGPPTLGDLPLEDDIARCRYRYRGDGEYYVTACALAHAYRAKYAVRFPEGAYPGLRSMRKFALRECADRLPNQGFYWEVPVRIEWRAGWRYAICYKSTSGAGGGSLRVSGSSTAPRTIPAEIGVLKYPAVHGDRSGR